MNFRTVEAETHVIIYLSGRIDGYLVREIEARLTECMTKNPDKRIILNLHDVEHIDSSGLAVLVSVQRALAASKRKLFLVDLAAPVRQVIDLLELTGKFNVFPTEDAALNSPG